MSNENKNETDEKFIERSMYENKSSKNPFLPLLGSLVLAVGVLGFGVWGLLLLRTCKMGKRRRNYQDE